MTIDWQHRYDRIQTLLGWEQGFVDNGTVIPRWIDSRTLWWSRAGEMGREIRVCNVAGEAVATITYAELYRALSKELESEVEGTSVLGGLDVTLQPVRVTFEHEGRRWQYDQAIGVVTERPGGPDLTMDVSPDGLTGVFCRGDNLWVRDLSTGEERQLTRDGTPETSYAAPCLARRAMPLKMRPEGRWSSDSSRYFTLQTDERHVPELAFVDFTPAAGSRPTVTANRTTLPPDERPAEFRLLVIDIVSGEQVQANYQPLPMVRMNDTVFSAGLTWWARDDRQVWFVHLERGEKAAHLVRMDAQTGECTVAMTEASAVPLELSVNVYTPALIQPLQDTDELVWYSERSGRGHLYLVDLTTGDWKGAITSGDWQVRDLLSVDPATREVALLAGGLDPADPYLRRPCLAPLDGGDLVVLSDSEGDHQVWRPREFGLLPLQLSDGVDVDRVSGFAPDGQHFVETVGAIGGLPRTVLRCRDGSLVGELETATDVGLPDWFRWPTPFSAKAADGVTDVYGVLFEPPDLVAGRSYPLIDLIYGGPQVFTTPKSAYLDPVQTGTLFQAASLAQLGGYCLVLDGRGTAMREQQFRHASLGSVQTASDLEDHEVVIRQLAAQHPVDLERVGMTGFSGGGYATALAAFTRGDFFRVTVAGGGNYDQTLFWHGWGERYHGAYDAELYAQQAAHTYAAGLQGKLMLIHGLLDSGCHPAGLFQVVHALNEANKDYDLVLLPQTGHHLPGYALRRRADHFVRHLFGGEPPAGAVLEHPLDQLIKQAALAAGRDDSHGAVGPVAVEPPLEQGLTR